MIHSRFLAISIAVVCAWSSFAAAQAVSRLGQLRTVDGNRRPVRIIRISDDWQFEMEDATATRFTVGVDRLVMWGEQQEPTGPYALLVDGSVVAGDLLGLAKKELQIGIDFENFSQRSVWEPANIPLTQVRGVVLQPPAALSARDKLISWLRKLDARGDRIRLINGDELVGAVLDAGPPQPVEPEADADADEPPRPTLDEEPDRVLRFKAAAREAFAPLSLVRAIAFNPALTRRVAPPGPQSIVMRMAFRDGSSVLVRSLEDSGALLKLTTLAGAELTLPKSRLIRQLSMVQRIRSPVFDYLSDLKPIGYRHIPFLTTVWPKAGVDENLQGGWLRSRQGWSAKGIAMHSTSRLAFELPEQYERFEAEASIDTIAGDAGSVSFRVYVDRGDGKFISVHASSIIRGGQSPTPLSVDVRGAKRLALIVDFADRGDAGDHANWLNARLIRAK